jgi:hypothetical protein
VVRALPNFDSAGGTYYEITWERQTARRHLTTLDDRTLMKEDVLPTLKGRTLVYRGGEVREPPFAIRVPTHSPTAVGGVCARCSCCVC